MAPAIRLVSASQLSELPPTEILENTRLIKRGLNVVFGPSGAFKSFYTLDAALIVAQTSPVIYVAAEGVGGLHRRVAAWCEHYQQSPGQLYFICQEISLLDSAQVNALIALIKPVQPTMTVFDTLARCIPGGDENSAKDMGVAVRNSTVIQRQVECAITWIHHTNRAERGERGSGAIRGAADAMIELSANGDGIIQVSCSKLKDDERWLTEDYIFQPVGTSGVLVPSTASGRTAQKLSEQEAQILDFLALEVFDTCGAAIRQMVAALNITERHLYRILSKLKREKAIQQDKKGDPYSLTEGGKTLASRARMKNTLSIVKPIVTAETTN